MVAHSGSLTWSRMPSVPLVAQRSFPYAGQPVVSGQRFLAQSAHDAQLLKLIGHAIDAPPLERSDPPEDAPEPVGVKPKRTYRRRPVETTPDAD